MKRAIFLVLPIGLLAAPPLTAEDGQDLARAALEAGRILPLTEILARTGAETLGRVIEIEYEEDDGLFEYEIEILLPDGRLLEIEVDAATGEILERDYEDDD